MADPVIIDTEEFVEPIVAPVVETEEFQVPPMPVDDTIPDGLDPNFDYAEFNKSGRINFSPEYFKDIMTLYKGRKSLSNRGARRFTNKEGQAELPESYSATQAFAIQAATEFNKKTGMGSYQELKNGTSKFTKGLKFTDEMILEKLTNMEEKGFLASLGRRAVANVPSSIAFGTGFAAGKRIQNFLPPLTQKIPMSGYRPVDAVLKTLQAGQTAYTAGRFSLPYITGIGASIFANVKAAEPFSELFLGEKKLPIPESYAVMRRGEAAADVLSFTPYAFFADRAQTNMLTDYFANRLASNPGQFGRGFDLTGKNKSFSTQWKEAQKTAQNKFNQKGEYVGTRGGKQFQGPLNVNDLNERGVAAVLQGKTSPKLLRMLLTMENALKKSGKDARKNKSLTLFYETLAAGGASAFVGEAAKTDPFGMSEMGFELLGGVATPLLGGQTLMAVSSKIKPYIKELVTNVKDRGFLGGAKETVRGAVEEGKQARGFKMILNELEKMGELDTPEQMQTLFTNLEQYKTTDGVKQTSGQASKSVVIQAMEAALARDFKELSDAQQASRTKEIEQMDSILQTLALGEGTEFARESTILAAKIQEAVFEQTLNGRLRNAEDALLSNLETLKKSDVPAVDSSGLPLSEEQQEILDSESIMDLSNRLFDMLSAQKRFARDQQRTLYSKVGNVEVNKFFTEDGEPTSVPNFMQFLIDENVIDESVVKKELASLYQFSQRFSDKLGLNQTISLDNPKLEAYKESRTKLTGSGAVKIFDNFNKSISPNFTDDGLPENVTDEMIDGVRQARNKRKGEKVKDTFNLYDSYMDALIEKKGRQGIGGTTEADRLARKEALNNFDVRVASLMEGLNEAEASKFSKFIDSTNGMTAARKASEIRKYVSTESLRPGDHPGNVMAEKMEFIADNPFGSVSGEQIGAEGIPLNDLRQIRTQALEISRNGDKSPSVRRAAGMFVAAVEDDLSRFADFAGDELAVKDLKNLQTANAYTKAFSDVFYRSYVGDALAETRDGGFRISPEIIAAEFTKSRFDPNFLKIRDIEEIGKFMRKQKIPGGEGAVDSIHGVLDRIVRAARVESIDPQTGVVSEQRLADWINKNAELENIFPEMFADLKQFDIAQTLFKDVTKTNNAQRALINKQINFSTLLRNSSGEIRNNPQSAIAEAMKEGKDQVKSLDKLLEVIPKKGQTTKSTVYEVFDPELNMTQTFFDETKAYNASQTIPNSVITPTTLSVGRDEAIDGFKASMFEYLVFSPGQKKNKALSDPIGVYNELFERKLLVGENQSRRGTRNTYKTMAEYLQSKGVFNDRDIGSIKKTLKALIDVKTTDAASLLGENFEEAKPLLDFALAVSGSAIGTKSQSLLTGGTGGPGSIIAAGKGAEAMRNIFLRMPQGQRMLFTVDLLMNPDLMAKMLRRYGDEGQRKGVVGTIQDYLTKGFYSTAPRRIFAIQDDPVDDSPDPEDFNPNLIEENVPLPPSNQQGFMNTVPQVNPTRTAAVTAPSFVPQNVSPVNQAPVQPSGPVDRTRYAAMFPNDSASALIKQGIGSMVG